MIEFVRHPGSRTFLWMWLGQTVSTFGTSLTAFALGVYLYEKTGQATPLALLGIARFLPEIALGPLAGVLVDRIDRKWGMLLADLGQGLAVLAVLLLLVGGHIQLWMIYLLFALASVASSLQWTAEAATITLLVPREQLGRASGLQSLGDGLGSIAAPAVAGALLLVIGISRLLAIDVLTYASDAIILLSLTIPRAQTSEGGCQVQHSFLPELAAGWRYIRSRPGLLGLMAITAVANLVDISVAWRLVPPLILAETRGNTAILGLVGSVFDLGMLLGGSLMSVWGGPRSRITGVLGGSILVALCGETLVGLGHSLPLWLLGAFLGSFFIPIRLGSGRAIWQSKVTPDLQGRVFAVRRAVSQMAFPLGLLLVGPLADQVATPAMRGPLGHTLRPIFGMGAGRGYALTMAVLGLLAALVYAAGYLWPVVRQVETDLPDAVPATAHL